MEVDGRDVALTNLDKVLYPDAGVTKAEVVHYYAEIAPVLLPHLADRPVTFRRYPGGVDGPSFFEKNAGSSAPAWVRTADVARRAGGRGRDRDAPIHYVLLCDRPSLVWAANLAALELHTPMWKVRSSRRASSYGPADLMVFDLDPGEPAAMRECCAVGLRVRDVLDAAGYDAYPKTSGSKGLQLYVPQRPARPWEKVRDEAHRIARELEATWPDDVVSNMRKDLRLGKVLIDWSQNHAAKTTIAPYSLRARSRPTVSTPVAWDEVEAGAAGRVALAFEHADVLERVRRLGDLFEPLLRA
ncbi:MAG: non-homologous end-joining DNA ligase [Acidimicrobiales bacterium]